MDTKGATRVLYCQNYILASGPFFLDGKRKLNRCTNPGTHVVAVNPYKSPEKDGTKVLCADCERWDFRMFPRWKLPQ